MSVFFLNIVFIFLFIFNYFINEPKKRVQGLYCDVYAVLVLVILHRTCPSAETLVAANLFHGLRWFSN